MNSKTRLRNMQHYKAAYNFEGILGALRGNPFLKPTIEFRQHEGVDRCQGDHSLDQDSLWHYEFRQDRSFKGFQRPTFSDRSPRIGRNSLMDSTTSGSKNLGPILAEQNFTIVNLLQAIDLPLEALYYKNRGIPKDLQEKPQHPCPSHQTGRSTTLPTLVLGNTNTHWHERASPVVRRPSRRRECLSKSAFRKR